MQHAERGLRFDFPYGAAYLSTHVDGSIFRPRPRAAGGC